MTAQRIREIGECLRDHLVDTLGNEDDMPMSTAYEIARCARREFESVATLLALNPCQTYSNETERCEAERLAAEGVARG